MRDEEIYHMFDLRCFGREQNQFLIHQIKLQHVWRGDGNEQDVCVAVGEHESSDALEGVLLTDG